MIHFRIKELLEKNKMSRYKLQQYSDLSYRRINDYYFNRVNLIKVEELDLLCDLLNCEVNDIIEHKKTKKLV